jgi:CRISPR-associated DxTHG motif protein
MSRILIAFLGKGYYKETTYSFSDVKIKSRLSFVPLADHIQPDKVYLVGTRESLWHIPSEEGLNAFSKVIIPLGQNAEEFWEIFEVLRNGIPIEDSKRTELIFDITHCFRSIPFFVVLYAAYLRFTHPNSNVSHIFYGAYQPETEITPLVDLAPYLEMLEWIEAATLFTRYGEANGLSRLLTLRHEALLVDKACEPKPRKLSNLAKKLESVSACFNMTYVPRMAEELRILSYHIDKAKPELVRYARPLVALEDRIGEFLCRFREKSGWEEQVETARWYAENSRPTQALVTIREAVVSWYCETTGLDPTEMDQREKAAQSLGSTMPRGGKKSPSSRGSTTDNLLIKSPEIGKLWNKVTQARNNVGHALLGKKKSDVKGADARKASQRVSGLIEEAAELMSTKERDIT